ncbi:hypothetical protein O6P43_023892 [Quillaja saponaria]|uniref:Uncharacterized protein n=1 Tax=Quillaja saponaria TaxID=32244 RepID=A0AAD7PJ73_QUISA|nr:hypothetical protein O6P43_023892 [Quillaja saponaria]
MFDTLVEAMRAYNEVARGLSGPKAKTNFVFGGTVDFRLGISCAKVDSSRSLEEDDQLNRRNKKVKVRVGDEVTSFVGFDNLVEEFPSLGGKIKERSLIRI